MADTSRAWRGAGWGGEEEWDESGWREQAERREEEEMRGEGRESSLYALLHVGPEATQDELKRAYRQLAGAYHPDKFTEPNMQEVAKENFQRIREAYEILSDPNRRQVYDIYGLDGVLSGLELGPKLKSLEEIKQEYKKLQQQQEEVKRAARTSHASSLSLSVTAADALASWLEEAPRLRSMQMSSQVSALLSDSLSLAVGGSMATRRGMGGGSCFLALKQQTSPSQAWELTAVTGMRTLLSLSSSRQISERVNASLGATWHVSEGALGVSSSWTRQLSTTATATINVGMGAGSGTAVGWQWQATERTKLLAEVKVGEVTAVSATAMQQINESSQARLHARCGTSGIDLELAAARRLSDSSSASFSFVMGLQGMLYKLRFSRGGLKITIPLLLSTSLRPSGAVAALLLPLALYFAFTRLLLSPLSRLHAQSKSRLLRQQTAEEVRKSVRAARRLQGLMGAVVRRRQRQMREARGGGQGAGVLEIKLAVYGNIDSYKEELRRRGEQKGSSLREETGGEGSERGESDESSSALNDGGQEAEDGEGNEPPLPFLDVTIPLQFHVDESQSLVLHSGISKRGIMGSCDPCPNMPKLLYVKYSFGGEEHELTVGDLDELKIP